MPQGTPGTFDPRNPTLLPTYGTPTVDQKTGAVSTLSPADVVKASPRVAGTATVTVGGTITDLDTCSITFTSNAIKSGTAVTKQVTVAAADGLVDVAAKLSAAINGDADLKAAGIYASHVGAVLTVSWPGPVSLVGTPITKAQSGTITLTLDGNGGKLVSGSGAIIAVQNFQFALKNGGVLDFQAGQYYNLTNAVVIELVTHKQPII